MADLPVFFGVVLGWYWGCIGAVFGVVLGSYLLFKNPTQPPQHLHDAGITQGEATNPVGSHSEVIATTIKGFHTIEDLV